MQEIGQQHKLCGKKKEQNLPGTTHNLGGWGETTRRRRWHGGERGAKGEQGVTKAMSLCASKHKGELGVAEALPLPTPGPRCAAPGTSGKLSSSSAKSAQNQCADVALRLQHSIDQWCVLVSGYKAGLFRSRSQRPAWTVPALGAGAIWPRCTACWVAAASPEPGAAEPDARSAELSPWHCRASDRSNNLSDSWSLSSHPSSPSDSSSSSSPAGPSSKSPVLGFQNQDDEAAARPRVKRSGDLGPSPWSSKRKYGRGVDEEAFPPTLNIHGGSATEQGNKPITAHYYCPLNVVPTQ
ncbi:unnamed protein product [Pleuronectes platessa]|uniref:Uncharacterized protein n=1 Tax=Pleuronectes platessa TaxID=8262 RepID=A0A9N7TXI6_PLEPL|nr:unnamed protein product [Pleuronectes platessa]